MTAAGRSNPTRTGGAVTPWLVSLEPILHIGDNFRSVGLGPVLYSGVIDRLEGPVRQGSTPVGRLGAVVDNTVDNPVGTSVATRLRRTLRSHRRSAGDDPVPSAVAEDATACPTPRDALSSGSERTTRPLETSAT
ncbi:hypothetical protein CURTO8I2_70377 [Curtobacterium sp. 8I-2]|nr:hypothetical protein CURTO8I2_70377 [Curtobacterium sp. 8I-2]